MTSALWVHEAVQADHGTGDGQERLVDVVAAVVTELQVPVLVQPTLPTLDDPAVHAHAAAVRRAPLGQHRLDPAPPQRQSVGLRVVPAVALHAVEAMPGPAAFAPHRWHGVDQ